MRIHLNGTERELPEGTSVEALLRLLEVAGGVAVAVDGQVVPRSAHATTALGEGAKVEVIRAVGGG